MASKLIVKHVRFTFDEWDRSIKKKSLRQIEDNGLRIGLIEIEKVKEPQIWNVFDTQVTVADDGYKWLIVSPMSENYVITMYMNDVMKPVIWYIDIRDEAGVDKDGVFYYDDIFLDIIVSCSNRVEELDLDELEEAYVEGIISEEQRKLALETARKIKEKVNNSPEWIYELCKNALKKIQDSSQE